MDDGRDLTGRELADHFEALVDVTPADGAAGEDRFRGIARWRGVGRVYGGQVIAQALSAAMHTVEGRAVHSLHAYFLRGGVEGRPFDYQVTRGFDGRSFCNRQVLAMQDGELLLTLSASFERPEDGPGYQAKMPDVTPPEQLMNQEEAAKAAGHLTDRVRALMARPNPLDVRPVGLPFFLSHKGEGSREPVAHMWFRSKEPVIGGDAIRTAILAYASDLAPLTAAYNPHRGSGAVHKSSASLDHAVWFHETPPVEDWMLFTTDTPWSGHGRALGRGLIFARDGRLIASVVQEGVMRLGPPPPDAAGQGG